MSKNNSNFFEKKKEWSIVKDELFGRYFKPYVSKIVHTKRPLVYVDCFAGKGKFEDGNPGSPLIALNILEQCKASSKIKDPRIETVFIELNHSDELRENLKYYPDVKIFSGAYEEKIEYALKDKENCNIFLYLDPYGIKGLRYSLFESFSNEKFNSIELLINMNSFGFMREACRSMGVAFPETEVFEDLVEYEPTMMDTSQKSIIEINEIAGGDYWQPIVISLKQGKIDGYEAEAKFAEKYCQRLSENYTYVLNMPVRIKRGHRPKYRLIHATNHPSGCLLMVENIWNRWETLREIQTGGQMQMWEENYDNELIDDDDIREKAIQHFSQYTDFISLSKLLANFFTRYGAICSVRKLTGIIRQFENSGRMDVLRKPDKTRCDKPTKFMTESKEQSVCVRWIR